jgi:flagellar motility protein MotE (MotC chaperone)
MTETETELDTELADDDASPSSPYPYPGPGAEPENSFSSLSDGERNTADGIDDERFFAEPSSGALSSNDLESHSPAPHRSPQLHGSRQEEAETRPARDIAAIEQELARLREEEERRAREAEELRESIAMLQRIHLQGVRDREE